MSIVVLVVGSMQVQLDIAARRVDMLVCMTVGALVEVGNLLVVKGKVSGMCWISPVYCRLR